MKIPKILSLNLISGEIGLKRFFEALFSLFCALCLLGWGTLQLEAVNLCWSPSLCPFHTWDIAMLPLLAFPCLPVGVRFWRFLPFCSCTAS